MKFNVDNLMEQLIHMDCQCDGCGISPIIGVRYKCSVLDNFNFCANCEAKKDHEHPFLKIYKPDEGANAIFAAINEQMVTPGNNENENEPEEFHVFFRNLVSQVVDEIKFKCAKKMEKGEKTSKKEKRSESQKKEKKEKKEKRQASPKKERKEKVAKNETSKRFKGPFDLYDNSKTTEGKDEKKQFDWRQFADGGANSEWKTKKAVLVSAPQDVLIG